MSMSQKLSKNSTDKEHKTNPWLFCVNIGFFAGLIWGSMRWFFNVLNFTTASPGMIAKPFILKSFLNTGWGIVIGIACFIIFSIVAAMLYKVILGRIRGPWPGIGYGLIWWIILFIILGPFIGMTEKVTMAGWNTFFTELCIFLLWGVFIGYSIAFEFTDEASREPNKMPILAK